jgi:hypothetical protein
MASMATATNENSNNNYNINCCIKTAGPAFTALPSITG